MKGVYINPLKQITLPKGDIFHALKSTDPNFKGFGEAYFTKIASGEVKGWKKHNRMILNLIVPFGSVKFVIYDDRDESDTKGQFVEYILSPDGHYFCLTIEPGLWMAFAGIDQNESILLDIINELHDPEEADRKELNEIKYNFNV